MKNYLFVALLLLASFGCNSNGPSTRHQETRNWMEPNGKIKVLSTVAMINDLVKRIGQEHVDAITLIKADLDPHSYRLVKGDDDKIAAADILFYNGLGLEHGPSLKQALEVNSKAVAVGNKIIEQNPEKLLHFKGQVDPHIWMDISLWIQGIPLIVTKLSEHDPEHHEEYEKNGEELTQLLKKSHEEVKSLIQSIPSSKRYLVTSHDAFNYFARAYMATEDEIKEGTWGDRFAAPEGLSPESQLSVRDIQNIIDHLQKYKIEVLFPETSVSQDSLKKILSAGREKGMNLQIAKDPLYADSMGSRGTDGDTYPRMIKHNAEVITKYLKE